MKQPNTIYADGKKAIIYLRVSTEEQVDNFSLGSQEEICRKEAEKRGYEVIEAFKEEGRSAKTITVAESNKSVEEEETEVPSETKKVLNANGLPKKNGSQIVLTR